MTELDISYLLKKLAQFCENAGLYHQYWGLYHFVTVRKMKFNLHYYMAR